MGAVSTRIEYTHVNEMEGSLLKDYSNGILKAVSMSYTDLSVGDVIAVSNSTTQGVVLRDEIKDKSSIVKLPKEYKRLAKVVFVGKYFITVEYSPCKTIYGDSGAWRESYNFGDLPLACRVRRAA